MSLANETFVHESSPFSFNSHYEKLSTDFKECHRNPINVVLHLLTTPLGLIGFFSLLRSYTKSSSLTMTIASFYLLSLLSVLPIGEWVGTTLLCAFIVSLSRSIKLNIWAALICVVFGYLLQDLAHLGTGEKTFQSTYSAGGQIDLNNPINWLQQFLEHCYYLLPLVVHATLPFLFVPQSIRAILEAPLPSSMQQLHVFGWLLGPLVIFALGSYCIDSKNCMCFFPGTPYFYRVERCNLVKTDDHCTGDEAERKSDLQSIRKWTMDHNPAENTSSHYWYKDLVGTTKVAFDNIANSKKVIATFRKLFGENHYCVDVLDGMNEIYVSGPPREDETFNSDHVFFSRHVDGPFGFVPFVSVYRCIVGLDRNMMYTTHYPLAGISVNACEGDLIAFDFNREVHYITYDEKKKSVSDDFRVTLKLHYCVYPRVLAPLGWLMGWLNTRYNMSFRALFLKTIKPDTFYEHFLAWNVNFNTFLFDRIETLVGLRNVCYLLFVWGLWRATGIYEVFFALTSFIHYFRYISTFYVRKGIDFGSFKRDVLLFKTTALLQLFYHYFFPATETFVFDPISIGMIVVGYTVSVMATEAIGIDRTYFAAELGLVEPKWIDKFPYGYIPHPMIMSQVFALLGFFKADHFRKEWPYVIPIHVALYFVHMLQEHFDIYQKVTAPSKKTKSH